jgi:hypothetical protein
MTRSPIFQSLLSVLGSVLTSTLLVAVATATLA